MVPGALREAAARPGRGWTVLGQWREQRAGNPATAAVGGQIIPGGGTT
jgi:hypothetical protein